MIVYRWPDSKSETPLRFREYWDSRDMLSVTDGIVYNGMRIVIPPSLRNHMLKLIHQSHLGIVKCKHWARKVMYWPAMNTAIDEEVRNCSKCVMYPNKQTFVNHSNQHHLLKFLMVKLVVTCLTLNRSTLWYWIITPDILMQSNWNPQQHLQLPVLWNEPLVVMGFQ